MRSDEVPKIFNGFLGNIYGEVVVIEGGAHQDSSPAAVIADQEPRNASKFCR